MAILSFLLPSFLPSSSNGHHRLIFPIAKISRVCIREPPIYGKGIRSSGSFSFRFLACIMERKKKALCAIMTPCSEKGRILSHPKERRFKSSQFTYVVERKASVGHASSFFRKKNRRLSKTVTVIHLELRIVPRGVISSEPGERSSNDRALTS